MLFKSQAIRIAQGIEATIAKNGACVCAPGAAGFPMRMTPANYEHKLEPILLRLGDDIIVVPLAFEHHVRATIFGYNMAKVWSVLCDFIKAMKEDCDPKDHAYIDEVTQELKQRMEAGSGGIQLPTY